MDFMVPLLPVDTNTRKRSVGRPKIIADVVKNIVAERQQYNFPILSKTGVHLFISRSCASTQAYQIAAEIITMMRGIAR